MVQIFWRIICGHMVCLHKFSWISETICVLLIYFYKKIKNAHSYPDKISGYPRRFIRENIRIFDIRRISDILYSNSISGQNIRIRIRYPKKVRISKNSIRTRVHHLRIWIRTDIFRTILHPYEWASLLNQTEHKVPARTTTQLVSLALVTIEFVTRRMRNKRSNPSARAQINTTNISL
jgi:hypothetical protein